MAAELPKRVAASDKGSLLRRLAVLPAALLGSQVVRILFLLLTGGILRVTGVTAAPLGILMVVSDLTLSFSFIAIGTWVAPVRKSKAAWVLFAVYLVCFLLIELFRTPQDDEPLSHLTILLVALAGAFCSLLLMLWLNRCKPIAPPPSLPQNPWSRN